MIPFVARPQRAVDPLSWSIRALRRSRAGIGSFEEDTATESFAAVHINMAQDSSTSADRGQGVVSWRGYQA